MAGSHFLLWALAGFAGLASVAPQIDRAVDAGAASGDEAGFAIPCARDGQFYVGGRVGDVPVRFLVDPDADAVILAGADADRIAATPTTISVGPRRATDLPLRVSRDLPVSILGRPFLVSGGSVVRGDRLILR